MNRRTPSPTLPAHAHDLGHRARTLIGRLSEAVALAALDEPALVPLADALTEADDAANRFADTHPTRPSRLSTVQGATHPPVRADFPLRPHSSGLWVKAIGRRAHYFGPLSDPGAAERRYVAFLAGQLARAARAAGMQAVPEVAVAAPLAERPVTRSRKVHPWLDPHPHRRVGHPELHRLHPLAGVR